MSYTEKKLVREIVLTNPAIPPILREFFQQVVAALPALTSTTTSTTTS
jgi:hypothetical protein